MEVDSRLVGACKVCRFPDSVVWMQGLRIHPAYRGRGYGRALYDHVVNTALSMLRAGQARAAEYCTHAGHQPLMHLGRRFGFRIEQRFHLMQRPAARAPAAPSEAVVAYRDLDAETLRSCRCGPYLPIGWTFVHADTPSTPDNERLLRPMGRVAVTPGGRAIEPSLAAPGLFTPLDPDRIDALIPHLEAARPSLPLQLLVPEGSDSLLDALRRHGFAPWAQRPTPEVLVLRTEGLAGRRG
jgi:hypothetical protein